MQSLTPPIRIRLAWCLASRSPYVSVIHNEARYLRGGDINRLMMMPEDMGTIPFRVIMCAVIFEELDGPAVGASTWDRRS
jgi:hypothetical protein